MSQRPLAVYFWPEEECSIPFEESLLVIAVKTPHTNLRSKARQIVRLALRQFLAKKLYCSLDSIEFISEPGQPLKLLLPKQKIGLSISHESGLSLAAINMNGKVGIDLIAINNSLGQNEIKTLSTDYLGLQKVEYLFGLPMSQLNHAFAVAWTEFEARLKCREENLIEWSPSRDKQLNNYSTRALNVSEGFVATLAYLEH